MENSGSNQPLIRNLDSSPQKPQIKASVFLVIIAFAVILGIGIGYLPSLFSKTGETQKKSDTETTKSVGIVDKKTFKDSAEGTLREGGIDGEGNFHLERTGGESQNVYLTSTTVDLSLFVGKKVKVWGQTFSGEKAGWLMDVGLVETIK